MKARVTIFGLVVQLLGMPLASADLESTPRSGPNSACETTLTTQTLVPPVHRGYYGYGSRGSVAERFFLPLAVGYKIRFQYLESGVFGSGIFYEPGTRTKTVEGFLDSVEYDQDGWAFLVVSRTDGAFNSLIQEKGEALRIPFSMIMDDSLQLVGTTSDLSGKTRPSGQRISLEDILVGMQIEFNRSIETAAQSRIQPRATERAGHRAKSLPPSSSTRGSWVARVVRVMGNLKSGDLSLQLDILSDGLRPVAKLNGEPINDNIRRETIQFREIDLNTLNISNTYRPSKPVPGFLLKNRPENP